MRYVIGFFLAVLSLPLLAAERTDFGGTWINARFSETLKTTRSLSQARDAVEHTHPVWIAIDTEKGGKAAIVSIDGANGQRWSLEQKTMENVGQNWVLSDASGPKWLVTVDATGHLFILLHRIDDQSVAPVVLTKSPSRVQDPNFHIGLIVSNVMLLGKYVSPDGISYAFNQDQTASVNGKSMRYTIRLDVVNNNVFVILSDVQGNVSPFLVKRTNDTLELTDKVGRKTLLAFAD